MDKRPKGSAGSFSPPPPPSTPTLEPDPSDLAHNASAGLGPSTQGHGQGVPPGSSTLEGVAAAGKAKPKTPRPVRSRKRKVNFDELHGSPDPLGGADAEANADADAGGKGFKKGKGGKGVKAAEQHAVPGAGKARGHGRKASIPRRLSVESTKKVKATGGIDVGTKVLTCHKCSRKVPASDDGMADRVFQTLQYIVFSWNLQSDDYVRQQLLNCAHAPSHPRTLAPARTR